MRPQSPTLFLSPMQFTFYTAAEFLPLAWINHKILRCRTDGHGRTSHVGSDWFEGSCKFGLNRGSEREQHQLRSFCVHRDGRPSIEMNFVPSVRDHVPSVHVGGDGGLFSRPIHPRPFVPPLLWRQVACINEIMLRVSVPRCLSFELFKIRVAQGVAQPSALTKPRGKQQAAALLVGLSSSSA